MKKYNISSMSYECKIGYASILLMEDTQVEAFKEKLGKRIKELYFANEKKIEEISKQHQSEIVSIKLFTFLKLLYLQIFESYGKEEAARPSINIKLNTFKFLC